MTSFISEGGALRFIWFAVLISAAASASITGAVVYHIDHIVAMQTAPLVRTQRVELIDSTGRVRAFFELDPTPSRGQNPRLVMTDNDGRQAVALGLDQMGNGALSFSSEHWNTGAVVLGHLNIQDPIAGPRGETPSHPGGWGLQVRSPENQYVGVGFFNSGRPLPAPH